MKIEQLIFSIALTGTVLSGCVDFIEIKDDGPAEHFDCTGGTTDEFPFLESAVGKLYDEEDGVTYSIVFHKDRSFEIYYLGKCNLDNTSSVCRTDSNQLKQLEFYITGFWDYYQKEETVVVYKEKSWFQNSIDHTFTQIVGACNLNVTHSDFPGFETGNLTGSYHVNCEGRSMIIMLPQPPVITLFFNFDS